MRLLVTGFGPFGLHEANPSQLLAESSGQPFHILTVTYAEVDDYLSRDPLAEFDAWLMIGVHGTAEHFHLETVAKNWNGLHPDIAGVVSGPGPIDPRLPAQIHGSLWRGWPDQEAAEFSHDAGSYLCNYLFFRALSTYPYRRLGFLHVPTETKMPLSEQQRHLQEILAALLSAE